MLPSDRAAIAAAVEVLSKAKRALFITGAGVSADSGLPTYRGVGGLYEGVATDSGLPIEVALSGATFRRDPALTWKYIAQIEAACRDARPNRAHQVLARLAERLTVVVLTQNVDGFHVDAGSSDVIEIHGTLRRLVCTGCGHTQLVVDFADLAPLPRCHRCQAVLRPDVVLFGEMLHQAQVARLHSALSTGFDVVFSVGTTSVFPYIAEPVVRARRHRIPTFEINPGDSEVSHLVDHRIRLGAARALDAIEARLGDSAQK